MGEITLFAMSLSVSISVRGVIYDGAKLMQVMSGIDEVWCKSGGRNGRGLALGVIILLGPSAETTQTFPPETETALAALGCPPFNIIYATLWIVISNSRSQFESVSECETCNIPRKELVHS